MEAERSTCQREHFMAFRFQADQTVIENLKRIAREEIEAALAEIADPELDTATIVHQVRKRTKKVRGLLRLVRSGMQELAQNENAIFRDAAAQLSSARDTDVALATLDALKTKLRKRLSKDSYAQLRKAVKRHQPQTAGQGGEAPIDARLEAFAEVMRLAQQRIADWTFAETIDPKQATGHADLAIGGMTASYRKARRRMKQSKLATCDESQSAEEQANAFHDWRKAVKDHGYHLRLLRDALPDQLKQSGKLTAQLGELLGDDHDLTILSQIIRKIPRETISAADADAALSVLQRQSQKLREQALELGSELFADRPRDFREQMTDAWDNWQS